MLLHNPLPRESQSTENVILQREITKENCIKCTSQLHHVDPGRVFPYFQRYSATTLCDGAQMANFWRFFASCSLFSTSRLQHVSDLHPKFALRPHRVWKYGRHPICDGSGSVLFLSLPRSEGWPHHGRTFSIYLYPLSF